MINHKFKPTGKSSLQFFLIHLLFHQIFSPMNKLFRNYLFLLIPVLTLLVVSCKDDEDPDPGVAAPQITSVSPTEGLPGSTVTITGTNLANATSVTIGGETATTSNNTATSITATVPANATAGETEIRVTTAGGSDTEDFTVLEDTGGGDETTITGVEPAEGGPNTEVIISGTNFTGATGLMIGDTEVAAEDFEVSEDGTTITFTIPEDATEGYTGVITVTNAAGEEITSAEDVTFTFTPGGAGGANITSVTPMTVGPGSQVTLTGTNLTGITGLRVGDTEIEDFEVDETGENVTFTIPEDATEGYTGTFTVTTAEGDEVAGPEDVTLTFATNAPVITGIDPEDRIGEVGDVITITGRNLAVAEVFFTGANDEEIQADIEATSSTDELIFTIPEGAVTGPITLRVTNAEGEEFEVTTNPFTIEGNGGGDGQAINENGGFEDAEVGAITEGSVPGWSFGGNDGELANFEIVEDEVQEGERALAVSILALGENAYSIEAWQEGLEIEPNTTYSYSVWVLGEEGTQAHFTVGLPEEGNYEELGREEVEMTGEWQEVTMEFTTGDDGIPVRTPIHFSLEGNVGQTIYIDNLQVMPAE